MLQAQFVLEVCKKLKAQGISVAIDTSGFVWNDTVKEVLEYTDLVLLDIKNYDPIVYKEVTGVSLDPTLRMLDYLRARGIDTWIRYVIVPGLTDNLDSVRSLSKHLDGYPNVSKIELLPFHKMGEYKWKELGLTYTLADTREPEKELIREVKEILSENGKKVSAGV